MPTKRASLRDGISCLPLSFSSQERNIRSRFRNACLLQDSPAPANQAGADLRCGDGAFYAQEVSQKPVEYIKAGYLMIKPYGAPRSRVWLQIRSGHSASSAFCGPTSMPRRSRNPLNAQRRLSFWRRIWAPISASCPGPISTLSPYR
jgi:hypothetical protein